MRLDELFTNAYGATPTSEAGIGAQVSNSPSFKSTSGNPEVLAIKKSLIQEHRQSVVSDMATRKLEGISETCRTHSICTTIIEGQHMRYTDFATITEAVKPIQPAKPADQMGDLVKQQYGETTYGTWDIKFNKMPNKNGQYGANAFHARQQPIKVTAASHEEAIIEVKRKIDYLNKINDTALKFSKATLDFNVEFTRDVISETGVTGVRLVGSEEGAFLIVAGQEYLEAFGDEIYGTGPDRFVKIFKRLNDKRVDGEGNAGILYGSHVTANQIKACGLQPFGRYAVEFEKEDPDYGHKIYRLVFDSVTQSSADKVRLHKPGLTVAVY